MNKEILKEATKCGWVRVETKDEYMTSFKKVLNNHPARINVWVNDRNESFTVGTYLKHPKKGKTQLFRKLCSIKEVKSILKNPRIHTRKGYS